jgi:glucose/arabinose dehydrogenase
VISRRSVLGGAAAGAAFTLLTDRADAAPAIARNLATGMVVPWGLAFLPNGDALVSERESGRVWRVRRTGGKVFAGSVSGTDGAARGEGGLLGLAVSPDFSSDRMVYAYLSTTIDNRVVRMPFREGGLGPAQTVLAGIPVNTIHNGGRIKFGPDRLLYVATGDAGNGQLSQDRDSFAGKILRINPADGSAALGNPFDNRTWSYGHRNVQGLAWDRNGRMLATEFGQAKIDELNVIVAGGNYGWPDEDGDGAGPMTEPYVSWTPTSSCSPSGLAVRGGRAWVGALAGRSLYAVNLFGARARRKTRYFHDRLGRIRTVELAPDGSLWVTTSNRDGKATPRRGDDKVVRIAFR